MSVILSILNVADGCISALAVYSVYLSCTHSLGSWRVISSFLKENLSSIDLFIKRESCDIHYLSKLAIDPFCLPLVGGEP